MQSLDHVVEQCRRLNSIDFRFRVFRISSIAGNQNTGNITTKLSLVKPRPDIKHVTQDVLLDTDKPLLYIMRKFPHLESLVFKGHPQSDPTTDPPQITPSLLGRFLAHIAKIPTHQTKYLSPRINDVPDVMLAYWTTIISENTPQQPLTIRYFQYECIGEEEEEYREYIAEIDVSSSQGILVSYERMFEKLMQPQKDLIEQAGHFIQDLHMDMDLYKECLEPRIEDDELWNAINNGQFLNHIFNYCTNLKRLTISYAPGINCQSEVISSNVTSSINTSVVDVIIKNSRVSDGFFHGLSEMLPSLQNLKLDYNEMNEGIKNVTTIDMENTAFNELCISTSDYWAHHTDILCVKILSGAGGNEVYYVCERPPQFELVGDSKTCTYEQESPIRLIQLQIPEEDFEDFEPKVSDGVKCTLLSIRCCSIATLKFDTHPFNFVITNP